MFWQEKSGEKSFQATDEVVDLSFKLGCKTLPLDHAWALSRTLIEAAPWLQQTEHTAIHLIHGAESGNGWLRPENSDTALLHLSRRTRFTLRVHRDNLQRARELVGLQLDIDGHSLVIGDFKQHLLVPQSTVFARHVITTPELDEEGFLYQVAPAIEALGIRITKMMGGRSHTFSSPEGFLTTRSLMLSDLEKEESIRLQQRGIGDGQLMGMGIFLPHKGVAAVKNLEEMMIQASERT